MSGDPPPVCTPVWQYILVMGDDINASVKSLATIGSFHKDSELQPLAKWLEKVAEDLRDKVENLTGWENK